MREDLIRQIRALERVPVERVKVFDPTTSCGIGLLEEMSLVELRERLAMVQRMTKEKEAQKRTSILKGKREDEQRLRERASALVSGRGRGGGCFTACFVSSWAEQPCRRGRVCSPSHDVARHRRRRGRPPRSKMVRNQRTTWSGLYRRAYATGG